MLGATARCADACRSRHTPPLQPLHDVRSPPQQRVSHRLHRGVPATTTTTTTATTTTTTTPAWGSGGGSHRLVPHTNLCRHVPPTG